MNNLIVGICGAGKTTNIIASLKNWKGSVLIVEQGGEYSGTTKDDRNSCGMALCYDANGLFQGTNIDSTLSCLKAKGNTVYINLDLAVGTIDNLSLEYEKVDYLLYRLSDVDDGYFTEPLLVIVDINTPIDTFSALPILLKNASHKNINVTVALYTVNYETVDSRKKVHYNEVMKKILQNTSIKICNIQSWHK